MGKMLIVIIAIAITSLVLGNNIREGELTENDARNLAKKFNPFLVFDQNEKYFPASIEWFDIDWSKANLSDPKAEIPYTYLGPNSLNSDANIYASVLTNDDGTVRISYAFLYSFNDCGPYLKVNVNTIFGMNFSQNIPMCPMGKHFGDLEHITLTLESDLSSIKSLIYAYHDSYMELSPEEVQLRRFGPVVYVALGSHASYPTVGEQNYLPAWEFKANTFSTSGTISEMTDDMRNSRRFPVRLLKFNGNPASDISREESYLAFLYRGRIGSTIVNPQFDVFTKEALAYAQQLKVLSPMAYEYVMKAIYLLGSEVKKKACYSLAGPGRESWW